MKERKREKGKEREEKRERSEMRGIDGGKKEGVRK